MTVFKAGGELLADEAARARLAARVAATGGDRLLVHGGGPQLDAACEAAGLSAEKVDGRRITTAEVRDLAVAVWRGEGSAAWVAALAREGVRAVGLCGLDGGLLRAVRRPVSEVHYGEVGDLEGVDSTVLRALWGAGLVPVVAPLAGTAGAELLNVNADTVAAALAVAVRADALHLLTRTPGILRDVTDSGSVLAEVTLEDLDTLREEGALAGGMLPKVAAVEAALRGGVGVVHVGATRCYSSQTSRTTSASSVVNSSRPSTIA